MRRAIALIGMHVFKVTGDLTVDGAINGTFGGGTF